MKSPLGRLFIDWFAACTLGLDYVVVGTAEDFWNNLLDEAKARADELGIALPSKEIANICGEKRFETWMQRYFRTWNSQNVCKCGATGWPPELDGSGRCTFCSGREGGNYEAPGIST